MVPEIRSIGSFKYFIMPNKRRRNKRMPNRDRNVRGLCGGILSVSNNSSGSGSSSSSSNSSGSLSLCLCLITFLCLNQVVTCIKVTSNTFVPTTTRATKESNAEPIMTRVTRLEGETAQFECRLTPLVVAAGVSQSKIVARSLIATDQRPQQRASVQVGVALQQPESSLHLSRQLRQQQQLASGDSGCEDKAFGGCGNLQDGAAVIDETPARADVATASVSHVQRVGRRSTLLSSSSFSSSSYHNAQESSSSDSSQMDSDDEYAAGGGGGLLGVGGGGGRATNNDDFLDDSVELILWYHSSESEIQPIYSVDARLSQQMVHTTQYYSSQPKVTVSGGSQGAGSPGGHHSSTASDSLVPVAPEPQLIGGDERLVDEENSIELAHRTDNSKQLNYNNNNTTIASRLQANNTNSTTNRFVSQVISRNAKHYALAKLSSRIRLRIRHAKAYLIIDKVGASDVGQYKCRVDFKYARTRYQLAKLDVITPVTRVQIKTTNKQGIDLLPANGSELLASSAGGVSGKALTYDSAKSNETIPRSQEESLVGVVEANEDETLYFECRAKDGWPNAKLAWWRVDWASIESADGQLVPRVTQLSSQPSESTAKVSNSIGATTHTPYKPPSSTTNHSQPSPKAATSELPYLINANTMAVDGGKQTNNGATTRPHVMTTPDSGDEKGDHRAGYSNTATADSISVYTTNTTDDDHKHNHDWLAWMTSQLRGALSKLGQGVDNLNPRRHQSSSIQSSPSSLSSSASEVSLTSVARDLAAILGDPHQRNSGALLMSDRGSRRGAETWQFLRQNQLVLYTCGASNTRSNKLLQQPRVDNEHGDKLARIRPIFRSILVQPNAWPRWIQMFLVSRRAVVGSKKEQIELTSLREEQNLHLNLADKLTFDNAASTPADGDDGDGERQLQFACQVGGSLPEAKIEWTRTDQNITGRPSKVRQLVSDSRLETQRLIRTLASSNVSGGGGGASTMTDLTSSNNQWSTIKVHNIGIGEHETVIKCSAFNEKFSNVAPSSSDDGHLNNGSSEGRSTRTRVSTSVRLNITHVPSVKLELELELVRTNTDSNGSSKLIIPVGVSTTNVRSNEAWALDLDDNNNNNSAAVFASASTFTATAANATTTTTSTTANTAIVNSGKIRPILYGRNVTLTCNVVFANPPIIEPIEWSLNDTQPLDTANRLVHIVGKIQTSNRYHFIERLIVQFTDRSQSEYELQLKCRARNALGQAKSNTVRVVIGQLPYCSTKMLSTNEIDVDNNQHHLTDKDPSVYCPVISDQDSSTFHWLVGEGSQQGPLRKQTVVSRSAMISLSEFDHLATSTKSNHNGFKITCYASDKFGSNDNNPCLAEIGGGKFLKDSHVTPRAPHNCAANLVRKNLVQKRQQQDNISSATHQFESNDSISSTSSVITTTKPRLLLAIECKNTNELISDDDGGGSSSKDELVHFDLYDKRDHHSSHFIKHLTSYPKDKQLKNLSLMLELGKELEALPLEDIEHQHVIVMSVTDEDNRQKQPNVTLYFNTDLPLASQNNQQSADRFPRTSDSGQRDRLWVISSISAVFISSFVLVIIAWVCKGGSNGSLRNKTQGLHNNNNFDAQHSGLQTEMYLVGEESRSTVYHNHTSIQDNNNTITTTPTATSRPLLLSKRGDQTATTSATTTSPYDFLIIDHTPACDASDSSKQAILLIDPETHICNTTYNVAQGYSAGAQSVTSGNNSGGTTTTNPRQYHVEPMIHLHPVSEHEDAILRAYYNSNVDENLHIVSRSNSSSTSGGGQVDNTSTTTTTTTTTNSNNADFTPMPHNQIGVGGFIGPPTHKPHLIRSPICGLMAAPSPNGYNFELNSQGELTMTDESSSFIHEDGVGGGGTAAGSDQSIICNQCSVVDIGTCRLADVHEPKYHYHCHHHQYLSHQDHLEARRQSLKGLGSQCIECHRLAVDIINTPADSTSHMLALATNPHLSPSSSSHSSVQQISTLKRIPNNGNNTKRIERVRFVDYEFNQTDNRDY